MINDGMKLGALIDALASRPDDHMVMFDFGSLAPTKLDSYRGYYEDIALGFGDDVPTVKDLAATLASQLGTIVYGYKGGEYRVTRDQTLWVANYGRTSDTYIVGIGDCDWATVLRTDWSPS